MVSWISEGKNVKRWDLGNEERNEPEKTGKQQKDGGGGAKKMGHHEGETGVRKHRRGEKKTEKEENYSEWNLFLKNNQCLWDRTDFSPTNVIIHIRTGTAQPAGAPVHSAFSSHK